MATHPRVHAPPADPPGAHVPHPAHAHASPQAHPTLAARTGPRATPPRSGAREVRIIILGSTGSIGTQTLETISHLNALATRAESPVSFRVVGLAAGKNVRLLEEQAAKFPEARLAAACDQAAAGSLARRSSGGLLLGAESAARLVREVECDMVVGAMVGAAGLPAMLDAISLGRDIALANKETLVAAGELVIPAARASGSRLLPVDSEHAGVWQCLPGFERCCPPSLCGPEVARVVLTASGGPFRTWSKHDIDQATPAQALKHPTWQMGSKVTIDSASLTNKALELIEAHWLFGLEPERLGVIVHPQSIVHALVEMADGNVIAQLAPPDMRTPIQIALTYPDRPTGISRKLDWASLSRLDFESPDTVRFPALTSAFDVMRLGGTAGAVFNGANEDAVDAFLAGQIPFGRISALSAGALRAIGASRVRSLDDVYAADTQARDFVRAALAQNEGTAS